MGYNHFQAEDKKFKKRKSNSKNLHISFPVLFQTNKNSNINLQLERRRHTTNPEKIFLLSPSLNTRVKTFFKELSSEDCF
jgi:hypothetical protein